MGKTVEIVEVGLRDGLQNEKSAVSVETRVEMALRLANSGLKRMELGAFVRPDKVPQMAGSREVIAAVLAAQKRKDIPAGTRFSALVPNSRGMSEALESKIPEIAVFASCTESFSRANINCSIDESFERFRDVVASAKKNKIPVRGYLSVCFGCPYEGEVPEKKVLEVAERLDEFGCYEISIGDTIGVADPAKVESLFKKLNKIIPLKRLAGHFHDTRGTALANILRAFEMGVHVFDASLGGLGGCPYAPGSAGNVASEDVIYMFERMGVRTGLDLEKYIQTNHWMAAQMQKELSSKLAKAGLPSF